MSGLTRRTFLKLTGVSGLALAVGCEGDAPLVDAPGAGGPDLGPWIQIRPDASVTIAMHKAEMGQGVSTTLPLIVAEELDVAFERVRVRVVAELEPHRLPTGIALTYGSSSTRDAFAHLRRIGAAARQMLVETAAARWSVDPTEVRTERGECVAPDGSRLGYGALVEEARARPVPEEPTLKDPSEFRLIGVDRERLLDRSIVEGAATYGIDVIPDGLEGRLFAAIRHAPVPGGAPRAVGTPADVGPAIEAVVELPDAVAVVASSYWAAEEALAALSIEFSEPLDGLSVSSAGIRQELESALDEEGLVTAATGDLDALAGEVGPRLRATFYAPNIAHAPMEVVNATAHVRDGRCDLWLPTQGPWLVRRDVAEALGIEEAQVFVYPTLLGGSYGRKASTDYAVDAARIAARVGQPVTLIWSREEDLRFDTMRPAFAGRIEGVLDDDGTVLGWDAVNSGASVLGFGASDPLSIQGWSDLPYTIPHQRVRHVWVEAKTKIGYWRSIGHSQNTFFVESFIDELAEAGGRDPLELRLSMIEAPRSRAVLERVAELARWGEPLTEGAAQGLAFCADYGSSIGVVCEASVDMERRRVRIHRMSAAVDCGLAIQPTGVRAQIEGGLIFGLSAALHEEVLFEGGRGMQSNFHDYRILRPEEAPEIQVHIMERSEPPGGVGEIATGAAAPALAAAIYAASGVRCRETPFMRALGFRRG